MLLTWDSRDLGQNMLTSGQFFARRSIFLAWAAWPPLQTHEPSLPPLQPRALGRPHTHTKVTPAATPPDTRFPSQSFTSRAKRREVAGVFSELSEWFSFVGASEIALLDLVDDIVRVFTLDRATHRLRGAQYFEHRALELLGKRTYPHDTGNPVDLL